MAPIKLPDGTRIECDSLAVSVYFSSGRYLKLYPWARNEKVTFPVATSRVGKYAVHLYAYYIRHRDILDHIHEWISGERSGRYVYFSLDQLEAIRKEDLLHEAKHAEKTASSSS